MVEDANRNGPEDELVLCDMNEEELRLWRSIAADRIGEGADLEAARKKAGDAIRAARRAHRDAARGRQLVDLASGALRNDAGIAKWCGVVDQLVAEGEPLSIAREMADLIMQVTTVRPRTDEVVVAPRSPGRANVATRLRPTPASSQAMTDGGLAVGEGLREPAGSDRDTFTDEGTDTGLWRDLVDQLVKGGEAVPAALLIADMVMRAESVRPGPDEMRPPPPPLKRPGRGPFG